LALGFREETPPATNETSPNKAAENGSALERETESPTVSPHALPRLVHLIRPGRALSLHFARIA
jgi:hypothetical protein